MDDENRNSQIERHSTYLRDPKRGEGQLEAGGAYVSSLHAQSRQLVALQMAKLGLARQCLESKRMLRQLHSTQENLTKVLLAKPPSADDTANSLRLERIFSKFPDYWDFNEFVVNQICGNELYATEWIFTDVYLDKIYHSEIRFILQIKNEQAAIKIINDKNNWLGCTSILPEGSEIYILPRRGSIYEGSNRVISSLSSTSWRRLQELVLRVLKLLGTSEYFRLHEHLQVNLITTALNNLKITLELWPSLLRYDQVELVELSTQGQYRRLQIRLENLSMTGKTWDNLEYTLATLDSTETFGESPRLEFREVSANVLNSWFNVDRDKRGNHLELRFARPNMMNIDVWSQLSDTDKIFITGLIATLHNQLTRIEQNSEHLLILDDWKTMSLNIVDILAEIYRSANPKQEDIKQKQSSQIKATSYPKSLSLKSNRDKRLT